MEIYEIIITEHSRLPHGVPLPLRLWQTLLQEQEEV